MTETVIEETPAVEVPEVQPLSIEDIEAMLAELEPAPEAPFLGDPDATWDYWTGLYNPTDGPTEAIVWARLRHRRNQLIADCDWRVVADASWDTTPWLTYRQALRDLPDTTTDPRLAQWPVAP